MKSEMVAGAALTFEQLSEDSAPAMASATAVYAPHIPAIHRPFDPPQCSSSATLTAHAQTLTLPDTMTTLQPLPVPTCSPSSAVTPLPAPQPATTGQFYQMSQPAVRHSAWQPQAWPAHTPMNCSPAATATPTSPYVYPQPPMATLPTTPTCYDTLPTCQRFVDPTAGAFAGSLPTVYSLPMQAAHAQKMSVKDYRMDGTPIQKVKGDGRKCRKVYGMENRARWCTQCRWKKACVRFVD